MRISRLVPLLALAAAGCAARNPAPLASIDASLAHAEHAFAEATAREGLQPAFSRFADDSAVIFRPEPVNAKAWWRGRASPRIRLTWYPVFVRGSASGDLGFTTGPYVVADSAGTEQGWGTYFTVWRRTPGGWRYSTDLGIEHGKPAAAPPAWHPTPAARSASAAGSGDAARSLLAADGAFAALASSAGFAAALERDAAPEMRLLRPRAFPYVGRAAALAAAAADGARRYTATPARAFASAAGDLGWTWGEYAYVHPGAGRRESGHYVRVWSRERGGPWRVLLDVVSPRPSDRDE